MKYIALAVVIVAILGGITGIYLLNKPSQQESQPQENASTTQTQEPQDPRLADIKMTEDKLTIEDVKVGTGAEAKTGNTVSVQYTGTLINGTKFDSSYDRGQPFSFALGQGQVIKGWDQGVVGMKVGGKRKLTIPSSLAYGAPGRGPIPPNSTLLFEIELLGVK